MQQHLISILTPFKNSERYIGDCLDSIINQTYSNWELIIVDDGSKDNSYDIVKSYATKDSRIKLMKNPGSGIIEALRHAYNHSLGDMVTRMDSDDIMSDNKLEVLSGDLQRYGKGHVAVGQVRYFAEDGVGPGYKSYENWLNTLTSKGNNYSEIYKECVIPSPCWMMYREDLDKVNAFNPNDYPEDYDLTFRCYEHNMKCIPCGQVIHYWRDYPTRTSRTHEHYAMNYFLDIKLEYFLKLDFDSTRPLAIWGAGYKGKQIAKKLVTNNIDFHWICDNPKKIGKNIYGKTLVEFSYLSKLNSPQSIITVANADAQTEIRLYLAKHNMSPMNDYFFFC